LWGWAGVCCCMHACGCVWRRNASALFSAGSAGADRGCHWQAWRFRTCVLAGAFCKRATVLQHACREAFGLPCERRADVPFSKKLCVRVGWDWVLLLLFFHLAGLVGPVFGMRVSCSSMVCDWLLTASRRLRCHMLLLVAAGKAPLPCLSPFRRHGCRLGVCLRIGRLLLPCSAAGSNCLSDCVSQCHWGGGALAAGDTQSQQQCMFDDVQQLLIAARAFVPTSLYDLVAAGSSSLVVVVPAASP
jgi:hypothetical protein